MNKNKEFNGNSKEFAKNINEFPKMSKEYSDLPNEFPKEGAEYSFDEEYFDMVEPPKYEESPKEKIKSRMFRYAAVAVMAVLIANGNLSLNPVESKSPVAVETGSRENNSTEDTEAPTEDGEDETTDIIVDDLETDIILGIMLEYNDTAYTTGDFVYSFTSFNDYRNMHTIYETQDEGLKATHDELYDHLVSNYKSDIDDYFNNNKNQFLKSYLENESEAMSEYTMQVGEWFEQTIEIETEGEKNTYLILDAKMQFVPRTITPGSEINISDVHDYIYNGEAVDLCVCAVSITLDLKEIQ